ncbi:S8 family serine peptidase [Pseudoneobacillus sp. C159]
MLNTPRIARKWIHSLLVFLLVLTMWSPFSGHAATKKEQMSSESLNQMKKWINEQRKALSKGPILHKELNGLTGNDDVSVIVQLSEHPVAFVKGMNKVSGKPFSSTLEKKVKDNVNAQHKLFEKQLNAKGIKAIYGFKYNYAFNGMSIKVKANQLKKLLKVEGVTFIEPDTEVHALGKAEAEDTFQPAMNSSSPFLDVPTLWSMGYEGQNVKVAVLDTGIDYHHPEFEGVYKGGYNFIKQTSTAGYARTRIDTDPYETSPLDRAANMPEFDVNGNSFYTDHGTHVAGTIAAQGNNPYGMKGIAPKIELYAYRVLGAYGSGSTSGIIAGIEKAVAEKMDIINLSLGSSNNSQTSADSIAINNAVLAGTTAVIANGNDGPGRGTVGSPATSAFAISVGNSTVPETTMKADVSIRVQGSAVKTYPLTVMAWKFDSQPSQLLNGEYDLIAVPNYGVENDYTRLIVTGKVVLISRGGGIPFVDKIAAAKKAGAVAAIIYNNETGPSGVFLGDTFHYITTFDMSNKDGSALRTALATKLATVTFNNFTTAKTAGDDINDSSSRGPSNPVFDIKPDVSAPGTNIMSSVPAYKKDFPNADYSEAYDRFTGTSMAAPHIAGIAALLKSKHPEWTPFDMKVAISNTAKLLDTAKYDVFAQGAGRVQPLKAATAEALAYSYDVTSFDDNDYENRKGTITFGNVTPSSSEVTTMTKDIVVKNMVDTPSDYTVTVQTTKAATDGLAAANVSVDQSRFTLTGEKTLKVTLTVPAGEGTVGNEILGYVKLTNGTTNLNLPFAANFGPPTGLKDFAAESMHISPNGDGIKDSTTIRYEFYNPQFTTWLELWDAQNQTGGEYEDGYLGYIVNEEETSVGPKTVTFDGSYISWSDEATEETAPDGVYSLDLSTVKEDWSGYETQNWIGPVFVKTTSPVISAMDLTVDSTKIPFTGSLQDSYIDWKEVIEVVFGEEYDVNHYLHGRYELRNNSGALVDTQVIKLQEDGTFAFDLFGLTSGVNRLKLIFEDAAGNNAEKDVTITKSMDVDPEPIPNLLPGQGLLVKGKEPMANLQFSLHSTGADPVWYDMVTDENGIFTHNLPNGEYHVVGIWEAPNWYLLNKTFTLQYGLVNGKAPVTINALETQLPPAHQWNIKGTLQNGNKVLSNIPFSLRSADGLNWYSSSSNASGEFVFNLPDGEYVVEGIWMDAQARWYELNQTFTVEAGKLVGSTELTIDIKNITIQANVAGTLTKGTQALANLIFSLRTSDGEPQWYAVQTDEKGQFEVKLPDGSYTIEGIWVGKENKWYVLNKEFTVAGTLALDIDVLQGPPEAALNITGLLTKSGLPLTYLNFSIEDQSGNWFTTNTDPDGNFGFTLPDGAYKIHGIWVDSEMKWYELNRLFTVTDRKIVGTDSLLIQLP